MVLCFVEPVCLSKVCYAGNYFSVEEEIEGKVDPVQGIEGLLRRPSGCGEQSMLKFGPNCAVVAFLAATNPGSEAPQLPLLREGTSK